jgi:hypothetical protein
MLKPPFVRSQSFAYGLQGYTANQIHKYNLAFLVSREMTLLLSAMLVQLPDRSMMFSFQHQMLALLQLFSTRNLPAAGRQEDSRPAATFHKTMLHKKRGINDCMSTFNQLSQLHHGRAPRLRRCGVSTVPILPRISARYKLV